MNDVMKRLSGIPCMGLAFGLLSGFFFASAAFTVALIPVNPIEVVVIRSVVQLISNPELIQRNSGIFQTLVYLPVVIVSEGMGSLIGVKGERLPLVTRAIAGFFSFSLTFLAVYLISLADTSTIVFSAPILVMVMAAFVLREECGLFQFFILMMTVAGVALVSRPMFLFTPSEESSTATYDPNLRMTGTFVAVGAAVSVAVSIISVRQMPKTPASVVINTFSVISVFMGLICLSIVHLMGKESGFLGENIRIPTAFPDIGFLLINCVCGLLDQVCLTLALKLEEAGLVALARSIEVVVAFAFQVLWLPNSTVYWTSVVGAAVVVASVALAATRRWLRDRGEEEWRVLWLILNCGPKDRNNNDILDLESCPDAQTIKKKGLK